MKKLENKHKKTEKIKALLINYLRILGFLLENGAYLNTIRPEFLLGHNDYNTYVRTMDKPRCEPIKMKLTDKMHKYISYFNWIHLFYQIAKVFYL